ncbi:MAG: hypothetical protein J0I48_18220 [Devosia sp.]|uniref:hypothetical protein n=1 Tax=unclassified Devosia TaxID=196773 RepID=UPI000926E06D|nr:MULTISPECIES: hypothetical protein [unclassified Devosia]MBL8598568.1 hypothetical protein [Devosia sp.]MBN9348105.1 hypothetical protein [Devosia sp.]OJX55240.1 MAG: hypothetical protein BGO81_08075 [Devosia sp. 66-22]
MAQQHSTFAEEMMAAGRGVIGLLTGDRQAGSYFDLNNRGLAGSFIALLLVTALNAVLPIILGNEGDSIARGVITVALLFLLQIGFSIIVLRQVNRMDGLVPYLVADNWATFFLTLVSAALAAAGLANDFTLIVLGVVVIIVEVNIARLIVTLPPLQIAMFLIAQLVGVSLGLVLISFLFPMPPEVADAVAALAQ